MSEHDLVRAHHDPSEGFDHSEPATGQIWAFTIGSVVILVVVIIALQQYFDKIWNDAVSQKVLEAPSQQLQDLRNRDDWALTHYGYVDKSKGQVRIPLERAQELFLQDAAAGKTFYPAKPTAPKPEDAYAPTGAPATPAAAAPGDAAPAPNAKKE